MIKIICDITREDGPLYFDCDGHAEHEPDRCVEVSTLCSMLVLYLGEMRGIEAKTVRDGKVTISIERSDTRINAVFRAAMLEFSMLAEKHPNDIKVY